MVDHKKRWTDPLELAKQHTERGASGDLPIIPPLTPEEKRRRDMPVSNPAVARCGECNMVLHQVMGYVCNSPHCPLQPRAS